MWHYKSEYDEQVVDITEDELWGQELPDAPEENVMAVIELEYERDRLYEEYDFAARSRIDELEPGEVKALREWMKYIAHSAAYLEGRIDELKQGQ